jgi:hypothetical protein
MIRIFIYKHPHSLPIVTYVYHGIEQGIVFRFLFSTHLFTNNIWKDKIKKEEKWTEQYFKRSPFLSITHSFMISYKCRL